jgi:agmatinase
MLKSYSYNFGDIENDFTKAKVVILPIPYEATTCYGKGTEKGPAAILNASRYITEFDVELQKNIDEAGFFVLEELRLSKSLPQEAVKQIEKKVSEIIDEIGDRFLIILGGEHTITAGIVKAFSEKYSNLSVLQLDAHADLYDNANLFDSFENNPFSHACVMKRIREMKSPVVQVGIRGLGTYEGEYIKKENLKSVFYAPKIPIEEILNLLTENVYLTVDVDVFDPSIMPSVGTPEPGGLNWYEVLNLIREVAKNKNIVGADVVEFSPIPGIIAPDYMVAKLIYKIVGYKFFIGIKNKK